ncbi:MAG: carboxypeptidase M32 [Candidatus Aenigmatarchaeota archaeon]
MQELDKIYSVQKEIFILKYVLDLLDWDMQTYMPKDSAEARADQIAYLSKLIHEKMTSKELLESIKVLMEPKTFSKLKRKDMIVIDRLNKDVEKERKLPTSFVEELSRATSMAFVAWQKAKKKSDFKIFQPHLEKIVELKRKEASYINLPGHPYNSLVDTFEEGMTTEKLSKKFEKLKEELVILLKKIKKSKTYKTRKNKIRKSRFPSNIQRNVSDDLIKLVNLPSSKSRLDTSAHPFTTDIGPEDVRITTNFLEENPASAIFSTVHEAGHALHGLGSPKNYENTVIFDSPSYGLSESQSRFWENMVARNILFWKYYFKFLKKKFKKQLKGVSLEQWYNHVNNVKPSLIRIEADEVTYCLHVIMRFEIETGLIEGSIKVKDLPKIWNKKMKEMLGVRPKNDRDGVLQDVHWCQGYFGYFPSYAIGTIYAAQLFDKLSKDHPEIKKQIQRGDLSFILQWLRKNVHSYGKTMGADDVIKKTCGEGLNIDVYIDYLTKKYLKIYK